MKIWILQTGEPIHIDSSGLRPMRAINLADALIEKGHQVVLWSSDFDHFTKKHRTGKNSIFEFSKGLEIRLIHSHGYKAHIGLARLFDHAQLAFNLKRELMNQTPPDIAFVGYPPIETAWVMTKWLYKNKVPSVVDVKDAWPEIYVQAINSKIRRIVRLFLWPYFLMMKSVFRKSIGINSVTEIFLDWSLKKIPRKKMEHDSITYLTAPEKTFSQQELMTASAWWDSLGIFEDNVENIFFLGTINNVYDFSQVIYAAQNSPFRYIIAGDGPVRKLLLSQNNLPANLYLPGWINEAQAQKLAERSKIAIAPFRDRDDFAMNITNKFFDAMRFGVPMVTSIKGYAAQMINENKVGMTYIPNHIDSMLTAINSLIINKTLLRELSINSKNLYNSKYLHQNNYSKLVQHLENIVGD
jgi:glycosyltransferase involved in cell wall biosynthesis